jgi:hypothetical protein
MPRSLGRLYTNTDADRQYGKGRTEFGPWRRLPRAADDPTAGLDVVDIDDELRNAKELYARTSGRGHRVLEETLNRLGIERAQNRARAESSPLRSFFTSAFSPQQREATARTIEGDSRNREGIVPRLRSFAAGAVGGAGEESALGGLLGEITPVNVATGFGLTRATPITYAIRAARAAQSAGRTAGRARPIVEGVQRIRDARTQRAFEAMSGQTPPARSQEETPGFLGMLRRWVRGVDDATDTSAVDRELFSDEARLAREAAAAEYPGTPSSAPLVRRQGDVARPSRQGFLVPEGRIVPRSTPTLNDTLIEALESTRAPEPASRRTLGRLAEPVPTHGTGIRPSLTAETRARQTAQRSRMPQPGQKETPITDVRVSRQDLAAPGRFDLSPAQERALQDLENVQSLTGGAGARHLVGPGGGPTPRTLAAQGGVEPTTATAVLNEPSAATPPSWLRSFFKPRVRITGEGPKTDAELRVLLREAEAGRGDFTHDLADPAEKAVASRLHRSAARMDADYRRRIADERGAADPALLGFLARTGGGALAGSAMADEGDELKGATYGALAGAVAPDAVRGLGRIGRAFPRGLPQFARQIFDEVQNARYAGMLSGFAVPKSVAGNIGAVLARAAETGRAAPIRSFLSPRTVRNYFTELRNPTIAQHTMEQRGAPNLFGRILGAGDVATHNALVRAGASPDEAQRLLLRTPTGKLGFTGTIGELLQSRGGKFVLPFQTTPIGQAVWGFGSLAGKGAPRGVSPRRVQALAALAATAGAGHTTIRDEATPLEVALTAPFFSAYSVPYLLGSAAGKIIPRLREGRGTTPRAALEILRGASPVPEIGTDIVNPARAARPITDPAVGVYFRDRDRSRSSDGRAPTRRAARLPRRTR